MGYYKSRSYPEYLVTIFCDDDTYGVTDIFREWFRKNNGTLLQDSMAYELDGVLHEEDLD